MTIRFETGEYIRSHGKEPRGRGCWMFYYFSQQTKRDQFVVPPGQMTLGEAKKWARTNILNAGINHVAVTVCP